VRWNIPDEYEKKNATKHYIGTSTRIDSCPRVSHPRREVVRSASVGRPLSVERRRSDGPATTRLGMHSPRSSDSHEYSLDETFHELGLTPLHHYNYHDIIHRIKNGATAVNVTCLACAGHAPAFGQGVIDGGGELGSRERDVSNSSIPLMNYVKGAPSSACDGVVKPPLSHIS